MGVVVVQCDGKKTRKLLRQIAAQLEVVMTNVERLDSSIEGIRADIARIKEDNANTITQLRADLDTAASQHGLDQATIADLTAAADAAERSLDAVVQKAADLDAENPEPGPAPEPEPEPAPPVEPTTPEEPVAEPAEPPAEVPADQVPRDELGNPVQ